jgi:O-antigen ligase
VGLAAAVAIRPFVFAVVATVAVLVAAWRWPEAALEAGVILTLTVRPWVDVFSERRAGLGPLTANPAVLIGLAVLTIAAVLALRRLRAGIPLWPDRRLATAHVFLVAAYGAACVSGVRLFGATGLAEGAREAVRIASVMGAFLLVCWWAESSPIRHHRAWMYLFLGATVPIAMALWQYAAGSGFLATEGLNRLQGTLSHPNAFGQYLLPFALIAVNAAISTRGSRRAVLLVSAIGLMWLIVQSYSRTVLLALVAGLVALPLLRARRIGGRVVLQVMFIVGLLGVVGGVLARDALRERFANLALGRNALDAALSGASENSYEWRLINWSVLISMGLAHPVMGHGAGMTTVLNPIVNTDNGVPYNAHNDFVRFFFEGGFLGLVGYVIYAMLLCGWSIRRARASPASDGGRAYAVAAAWLALLLLSAGNTEISLATASLYSLYGMLALQATAPDATTSGGSLTDRAAVRGAQGVARER